MTRGVSVVVALAALCGCARPVVLAPVTRSPSPPPTPPPIEAPTETAVEAPPPPPWPIDDLPAATATTQTTLGRPGPATPVWMSANGRFVVVYRWNPDDVDYRAFGPLSVDLHDVHTRTTTRIDEVIAFDQTRRWCLYRRNGHLVLLDGADGTRLDPEREGVLTEDNGYLLLTRIVSFSFDGLRALFPLRDGSGFVEFDLATRTARRTVVPGGVWYVEALALPQGHRILQWPAGSPLPRGFQGLSSGYIARPIESRDHPPFRRHAPPEADARLVVTPSGTHRLPTAAPASGGTVMFESTPVTTLDELELFHPGITALLPPETRFHPTPGEAAGFVWRSEEVRLYADTPDGWRSWPIPPHLHAVDGARLVSVLGHRLLAINAEARREHYFIHRMGWIDLDAGSTEVMPSVLDNGVVRERAGWLLGNSEGSLVMIRVGERRVRRVPSVEPTLTGHWFPYGRVGGDSIVPFPEHGGYVRAPGWLVDTSSGGCALTAVSDLRDNWYQGPFTVTCMRVTATDGGALPAQAPRSR